MYSTLNIPIKLMKRYCKDRALWELFVFAVCIKRLRGSSAIHPTVPLIRKLMGCSYYKAERLIERAKENKELFKYYEGNNLLIARSFTHNRLIKRTNECHGKTYVAYSEFCLKYKFQNNQIQTKDKDGKESTEDVVSHIAVSRELRDKLLVHAIKAKQWSDDLTLHGRSNKQKPISRPTPKTPLHCKRLGRIAGCHYTTAIRHLHKLKEDGQLTITTHEFIPVMDYRNSNLVTSDLALLKRRPFYRFGFLVVKDCNDYALTGNNDTFVNVIFNHKRRRKQNLKTKKRPHHQEWFEFINR